MNLMQNAHATEAEALLEHASKTTNYPERLKANAEANTHALLAIADNLQQLVDRLAPAIKGEKVVLVDQDTDDANLRDHLSLPVWLDRLNHDDDLAAAGDDQRTRIDGE